jgi:hypothetical protein
MKLLDYCVDYDYGHDLHVDLFCFGNRSLVSTYFHTTEYKSKWYDPSLRFAISLGTWNALLNLDFSIYGYGFDIELLPKCRTILHPEQDDDDI